MKNPHIFEDYTFDNNQEQNMSFEEVFKRIYDFMKAEPLAQYRLMIGTDSQVHPRETIFITGIVIQRMGKGAWACIKQTIVPRKMNNLHERISYETSLSEEIAYLFSDTHKNKLIELILPNIYKGASFTIEGHIDIGDGKRNKTREFVREMTSRIKSTGLEPKIKPEAIVASSYANRFTK